MADNKQNALIVDAVIRKVANRLSGQKYIELEGKILEKSERLKVELVDYAKQNATPGLKGEKGDQGLPGVPGRDGKDGNPGMDGKNGKDGLDGSPDSPKMIVMKLMTLVGNARLDASAIKNLDEYIGKFKAQDRVTMINAPGGGPAPIFPNGLFYSTSNVLSPITAGTSGQYLTPQGNSFGFATLPMIDFSGIGSSFLGKFGDTAIGLYNFGGTLTATAIVNIINNKLIIQETSASIPLFNINKFNSFGNTVGVSLNIPAFIFNASASARPEMSWYRGTRTFPEFSIRQHPIVDTGGQILAGNGIVAPNIMLTFFGTSSTISLPQISTDATGLSSQRSSNMLMFESSMWNGSSEFKHQWSFQSIARTNAATTDFTLRNGTGGIVMQSNGSQITWSGTGDILKNSSVATTITPQGAPAMVVLNGSSIVGNYGTFANRNAGNMYDGFLAFKNINHGASTGLADLEIWLGNGATTPKLVTLGGSNAVLGLYGGLGINENPTAGTMGGVTLASGAAVVATTKVTAVSRIFVTRQTGSAVNIGTPYISGVSVGVNFTITSTNVLDVGFMAWMLVEPV